MRRALRLTKLEEEEIRLSVRAVSYGTSATKEAAILEQNGNRHAARCIRAMQAGETVQYAGAYNGDHTVGLMILADVDSRQADLWLKH